MTALFHQLLLTVASVGQRELARQVQYLKAENEVLRGRLPGRVFVTPAERTRLIRYAKAVGSAIHQLATIVSPATVLRWIREEKGDRGKVKAPKKRGRRRSPEKVRRLAVKLARENDWGYTRIIGELKKLGVSPPSKNTVKRILKAMGLDPGPKRGRDTWDDFLKRHVRSLWQCDFRTRRVMTVTGLRDAFVLVFIYVKTRQVVVSPATRTPNETWVAEQAERFVREARGCGLKVRYVQRDRDTKFAPAFDGRLKRKRVKVIRNQVRSPNTNAFVERFIQTIQHECLDKFLVFGESHLDHLCSEFVAHYHEDRPHQSLCNEPIQKLNRDDVDPKHDTEPPTLNEVRCRTRLGGLLKSYSRRAVTGRHHSIHFTAALAAGLAVRVPGSGPKVLVRE